MTTLIQNTLDSVCLSLSRLNHEEEGQRGVSNLFSRVKIAATPTSVST